MIAVLSRLIIEEREQGTSSCLLTHSSDSCALSCFTSCLWCSTGTSPLRDLSLMCRCAGRWMIMTLSFKKEGLGDLWRAVTPLHIFPG